MLKDASAKHTVLEKPLDVWFRAAQKSQWNNLMEVRRTFASADEVEGFTVFNIKGNEYRLITRINYTSGRIFLRHVLTHAEYDRGGWKS
ncbi:MAG: type II toxin-antitoxin system HigB family toxin [Terriglobia bacterium]